MKVLHDPEDFEVGLWTCFSPKLPTEWITGTEIVARIGAACRDGKGRIPPWEVDEAIDDFVVHLIERKERPGFLLTMSGDACPMEGTNFLDKQVWSRCRIGWVETDPNAGGAYILQRAVFEDWFDRRTTGVPNDAAAPVTPIANPTPQPARPAPRRIEVTPDRIIRAFDVLLDLHVEPLRITKSRVEDKIERIRKMLGSEFQDQFPAMDMLLGRVRPAHHGGKGRRPNTAEKRATDTWDERIPETVDAFQHAYDRVTSAAAAVTLGESGSSARE